MTDSDTIPGTDIPKQTPPDCSLCGTEEAGIHWMPVKNSGTGETMDVDLCDECLELTRRYNRGEDVDWPTTKGEKHD